MGKHFVNRKQNLHVRAEGGTVFLSRNNDRRNARHGDEWREIEEGRKKEEANLQTISIILKQRLGFVPPFYQYVTKWTTESSTILNSIL